jgi:prepilin-type N-terminal cleavage/methylation domain-containing protein
MRRWRTSALSMPPSMHSGMRARVRSLARSGLRSRAGGFTLIELMVVVVLIGILAVLAIPDMTAAQTERRAYNDAITIAELFREARSRAMGRGAAHTIQMTQLGGAAGGDRGTFNLYEAQVVLAPPVGIADVGSPMSTCGAPTVWQGANSNAVLIDGVNLNAGAASVETIYQIWTTITGPNGAGGIGGLTSAFMCFTPLGRAYFFPGVGPPNFISGSPLNGEIQVAVQHAAAGVQVGITRTIVVPSNGATRIVSR